ncbi:MAG: hypothetical protein ABFS17_11320 [Chloroflexota bacterium]
MKTKGTFRTLLLVAALILLGTLISACKGENTEGELNVTPEKEQYVYFTVKVVRLGTHRNIGWHAQGQIDIKAPFFDAEHDEDVLISGSGFGMAGYDASGGPCINIGGWPVDYTATGTFNAEGCELNIIAEESWPKTEAHAICLGSGSEVEGPPYKLTFPSLKFTEVESIATPEPRTVDEIYWTDTFTLVPGVNTEKLNCIFSSPKTEN